MSVYINIAIVFCVLAYATTYLLGIKNGRVRPVLATWIFITFASILSVITDFAQTGMHGLFLNFYNIVDAVACIIILFTILINKNTRRQFTRFEKNCIIAVTIVFLFWLVSGQNIVAHLAIQVILVIAYFPTVVHLWVSSVNTESIGMWAWDTVASCLGLIEPIGAQALLPIAYGVRSAVSTFTVVLLILRLEYKIKIRRDVI